MYNENLKPYRLIQKAYRNYIKWSENGEYFLIAGCGNIDTKIDIYRRSDLVMIGRISSNHYSQIKWVGNCIMASVEFSKLKVGNMFRVFNVLGEKIHEVKLFENELYSVLSFKKNKFNEVSKE